MHNGWVGAWASMKQIYQRNPEKLWSKTDVRYKCKVFFFCNFFPKFYNHRNTAWLEGYPQKCCRWTKENPNKYGHLASISQQIAQLSLGIGSGIAGKTGKASVNALICLQQQTEGRTYCVCFINHVLWLSPQLSFSDLHLRISWTRKHEKTLVLPPSLEPVNSFPC